MQSDNDSSTAMVDPGLDASEYQEDRAVEWLLEQDYADPAEKLFTVSEQGRNTGTGLMEYEVEIANRPMFGSEGSSDDLSFFVSEEIVMSESGATDIFSGSNLNSDVAPESEDANAAGFSMAVDLTRFAQLHSEHEMEHVEEGFDILGLDEDDDIGERHVVMQKNSANKRKKNLRAVASTKAPEEKVDAAISLDIAELANLELNPPVAVSLLELPQVELSLEEPELEIEDLPTLEIIDDDAKTLSTEFEGFLSDTSLFSSNPEEFENQSSEVLADSVEQQIESTGHDASEIQIDLGDVLDLEKNSTDELVTADIDESSNFLSAQALSLAIVVPDQAELETPAVEEMSFDLQPIDLDVAFAELGEVTLEDNAQIEDEPELPAIAQELETRIELKLELALEPELGFDRSTDVQIAMETQSEILLPAQVARASEGSIAMVSSQGFLSVEQEHQPSDEAGEISASEEFGVMDYLAANEPPLDDAEFDQYLLAGEHLEDPNLNLEELVVDVTEGVVSVDPQLETTIDYHEDFNAQEGLNNDFVTAITGVIDQVMEELSACVNERLSTLLVVPESVQVEVMLGTDDVSMKQAREENYLPILEVATTTLAALSSLGQAEIDSIHVRFSNIYDDSDWNQLFSDDFVVPHSVASSAALASGDFPEFARELSAESVFDEETLSELDVLPSIPVLSDFDLETDAIFGEDIFSGDLTEEFAPVDEGSDFDFEALILSLADVETDIGEICGVSVDQFADTDAANSADTCPIVLPQESVAAVMASKTTDSGLSWCVPADINFSYTNQPSTEIFSEFLDAFIEEGASELEKLEDALGEWEKEISSESAYLPIPRILHTLKGIAKGVGLQRYGTLIHNFETLLDGLDRPEVGEQAAYFRTVNGWLDASAKGFEHIEKERTDIASELPTHSSSPVLDKVKAVVAQIEPELPVSVQALPDEPVGTPQLIATDAKSKDKQLADEGAKVLAAQQTIRMTPEALDRLLSLTNEAQQLGVRSSQATVRSKRSAAELLTRLSSVRAHVSKIAERTLLNVTAKGGRPSSTMDALEMDQYSELQEAANFLREGVEDLDDLIHLSSRQNTVAEALLKQQASIISSLGSSIQAARVIPVSRLMPGLRRIVRTVSADLGKSVSFRVLNEVGTLDRDNHARCQIILEHMTRNALDHGIETPEVRAAAGKDTTGSITIEARKLGSDYIVTLSDDGKGIDPEFMKDMAYERGLDIDVDQLSDEEAIRLIFHKGFSTATAVSEISGRGVGMDIVLSELQHIGGDIEIESTVGVGTTFKVRIPSNVTVNGALLVVAGEVSYAIPLDGLIAVEHVPVDIFYDAIRDNSQLSIFGMDCDPAYLATICHGDSLPDRSSWNATVPVIVAGSESRYMAIAIDDVTQALELVIRSLGAQFSMIPGLAGGATTADGKSIVALDLNALVESASSDALSSVSLRTEPEERMLVLVVDDSRTQRMVATSQFDNLGVETVTAENGLVAIDLLNTTHRLPDVILLDIEMPVKDGIQTLREIRKSTRYSDLPVIMVTSRTGAKHRALAEEAGCNGYMGKPFNFPKLVEQIADLTNHKFQLS